MTRPVHLSIGRLVLPAQMRGHEQGFASALRQGLARGLEQDVAQPPPATNAAASPLASVRVDQSAARTAHHVTDVVRGQINRSASDE